MQVVISERFMREADQRDLALVLAHWLCVVAFGSGESLRWLEGMGFVQP